MSFFSNFQSDKCPGTISGNPLNGLSEKVCIQAEKVFDACIRQIQLENYVISLENSTPPCPAYPLTFVSARSTSAEGVVSSLVVDRVPDKCGASRVQANVTIPLEVVYVDSNGVEGRGTSSITVSQDVLLFVPSPSIMPYEVKAVVSCVSPEGSFNPANNTFTVRACMTVILKITMTVELLVPSYGYCAIPPAQEYSREVCAGFFELPLYPQGKTCSRQ